MDYCLSLKTSKLLYILIDKVNNLYLVSRRERNLNLHKKIP